MQLEAGSDVVCSPGEPSASWGPVGRRTTCFGAEGRRRRRTGEDEVWRWVGGELGDRLDGWRAVRIGSGERGWSSGGPCDGGCGAGGGRWKKSSSCSEPPSRCLCTQPTVVLASSKAASAEILTSQPEFEPLLHLLPRTACWAGRSRSCQQRSAQAGGPCAWSERAAKADDPARRARRARHGRYSRGSAGGGVT
jgi:hypothetical protein